MKRLHITAEGQTEEAFVNKTLVFHLAQFNVYADVRCVLTGRKGTQLYRGGMSNYKKAKNDIVNWLNEERGNQDVAFTTMFDYYALPPDFPGLVDAKCFADPYQQVDYIEQTLSDDISDTRFIPYIQLHEFEALLFTEPQMLELEFFNRDQDIQKLIKIANEYDNPELINNGPTTAPSKRIINVFPEYINNKPTIGSFVANSIGVDKLKGACMHFRKWIEKLEQLG